MTERNTSERVSQIGAREGQFPGTDVFPDHNHQHNQMKNEAG